MSDFTAYALSQVLRRQEIAAEGAEPVEEDACGIVDIDRLGFRVSLSSFSSSFSRSNPSLLLLIFARLFLPRLEVSRFALRRIPPRSLSLLTDSCLFSSLLRQPSSSFSRPPSSVPSSPSLRSEFLSFVDTFLVSFSSLRR